ncbi:hypothetical protein EVA_02916 [gut metagenome]|uniref:Uncharacterized protein n=1 Tax=gut metagenome TaxID=749906 RepID=J9GN13_9ZZZZ
MMRLLKEFVDRVAAPCLVSQAEKISRQFYPTWVYPASQRTA